MWTPPDGAPAEEHDAADSQALGLLGLAHSLKEGKGLCVISTIVPPGGASAAKGLQRYQQLVRGQR